MRPFAAVVLLLALLAPAIAKDRDFKPVDQVIEEAIAHQDFPGAVLVVYFDGKTVYHKAYGNRALEPAVEPMTEDTIFDIASLTKLFTATAVMDLVKNGKVRLNDSVSRYLPEFAQNGKQDITIRMLLTHFSGLAPDLDFTTPWSGREEAFRLCMESTPVNPPGAKFVYSDINFEVLGFLLEKINGEPLPAVIERVVLKPLEMHHSRFSPPAEWIAKIAPTTPDEHGQMMRGTVHDPTARRMSGIAGHAGLYSTADDLAQFAKAILGRKKLLTPLLIEKMTSPQQPPWSTDLRGLGWDIASPFANNRGDLLPALSFGHTGYTGTSLWIDPTTRSYIILLTNSVHPKEGTDAFGKIAVRGKVANAVVSALTPDIDEKVADARASITSATERTANAKRVPDRATEVLTGIDVLEAEDFAALRGKRIGLMTNQTGVDRKGNRTIDVLAKAQGVQLVKLFSVEHGITGQQDQMNVIEQADPGTKLPVINVYGVGNKQRPTAEQLNGLDAVVIDIQDLGVRFYTYEGSTANFLSAAKENNVEVFILDRPDPLNGNAVQGPITDADDLWPNFPLPVPLRHGMTLGELAQMINGERKIGAKLTVVPVKNWLRADWFDATGLLWIDPSPNMRSMDSATVYPGVAQLEAAGGNISVGRGTDTPFEMLGAPWITPEGAVNLATYLNQRMIPGARFVPRTFTPGGGYIFDKQLCGGLNVIVTDRNLLDSPLLGAELIAALVKFYPNDFHPQAQRKLVGNQKVLDDLKAGRDPKTVAVEWQEALGSFMTVRARYLIYK